MHSTLRRGTQKYSVSFSADHGFSPNQCDCGCLVCQVYQHKRLVACVDAMCHTVGTRFDECIPQYSLRGLRKAFVTIVRWILSQSGESYRPMLSRIYGCTVWTCGGSCEKAMSGICLSGHVMRLASAQFGKKTSHGPLAVITDALIKYIMRMWELFGAACVDDLFWALMVAAHGACLRVAGGCPTCLEYLSKAKDHEKFVDFVLEDLHLLCSEKAVNPGQVGDFLGIILDTLLGKLTLTEAKFLKLMANLQSVMTWEEASPREASQVRGKLLNYSQCIQRIRPFAIPFTVFIGSPTTQGEWDLKKNSPQDMKDTAGYLIEHLPSLVPLGAPL